MGVGEVVSIRQFFNELELLSAMVRSPAWNTYSQMRIEEIAKEQRKVLHKLLILRRARCICSLEVEGQRNDFRHLRQSHREHLYKLLIIVVLRPN